MKLRTTVKIMITSSVVLLCSGFALHPFFRLPAAEDQESFDLHTLVPSSVSAVFATEDVIKFVMEVDELTCSRGYQYLYVSRLFSYLKQYFYSLLEDAPHGLSRQINQMLISFYEPDNDRNQVLYCRLGNGGRVLIDRFVRKYASSDYPSKTFDYKGEDIIIYPMADGDFLACYLTEDSLVLNCQKKLIEEVIDIRKIGKSLAADSAFREVRAPKKGPIVATIYIRLAGIMGWTEFDMELKDDFVYLSGVNYYVDTCFNFINVIRQQESIKGPPGETLPSTVFYFSKQGITDWASLLSYGDTQEYAAAGRTGEVLNRGRELSRYLAESTGQDLVACLFQREDSLMGLAAVLNLSVMDVAEAERTLRSLVDTVPVEEGTDQNSRVTFCYTPAKAYPVYRLPQTTLFTQLTSLVEPSLHVFATFYGGRLLLTPDEDSLSQYIRQLDNDEMLDDALAYRAGTDELSDSYHPMMMADFGHMLEQSGHQVHYVPEFLLHNSEFFRSFVLFAQSTCTDGMVYPNTVLKYKSEQNSKKKTGEKQRGKVALNLRSQKL